MIDVAGTATAATVLFTLIAILRHIRHLIMIRIHRVHGHARQGIMLMSSSFSRKGTLQRQQPQKQGKQNGDNFLLEGTHRHKR